MPINPMVIPIVALMIPIVIVPTSLWFRHRLKTREMEHAERIRAMELGRTAPDARKGSLNWPGVVLCLGIGAGVPIGSMFVAWLAVLTNDAPTEVFGIPLIVSLCAIWTAKGLAQGMLGLATEEQATTLKPDQANRNQAKPAFDPDAYDVVGSRG